jgi:Secretion system C-terminal sorting domain
LYYHPLVTNPTPANPATDKFTIIPGVSTPSVNAWQFAPSNVVGASTSSQIVNLNYQYTNSATGCTSTVMKSTTVNPIPLTIPTTDFVVGGGPSLAICQNDPPPTFATKVTGAIYKWYTGPLVLGNVQSGNFQQIGNTFTPSSAVINTAMAGPTTFYVTQTLSGCEGAATPITVTVNPKPGLPVSNSLVSYCKNNSIANLTASGSPSATLQWYGGINISGQPINPIPTAVPTSATAAELGLSSSTPNLYTLYVTQTLLGCQSDPKLVTVKINDVPVVTFGAIPDICKTNDILDLNVTPPSLGGTSGWSGTALPALNIVSPSLARLDPNNVNLSPGNSYSLTYTVTDASTCSTPVQQTFKIFPSIAPSILVANVCSNIAFTINNISTIVPNSSTSTIDFYGWSFLPGAPQAGSTIINNPSVSNTYKDPKVVFSTSQSITYDMITSDGCRVSSTPQLINVGTIPDFSFSWSNACQSGGTQFLATQGASSTYTAPNLSYNWNFAKNNVLNPAGNNSIVNPLVTYSNIGSDIAELIVSGKSPGYSSSQNTCTLSLQKPVYIVPTNSSSSSIPYTESFEINNGNWVTGGASTSWTWEVPGADGRKKIQINGPTNIGTKIWQTNNAGSYNVSEKSFLLTPCFNFSGANFKKPVISFDLIFSTPNAIDGITLQYATADDIDTQTNWKTLGAVNQGKNWYNTPVISSNPGNQPSGWSGNSTPSGGTSQVGNPKWIRSTFTLDQLAVLLNNSRVKFRIAFSSSPNGAPLESDNVRFEGIGIDNLFIGDRSRNVLIENFTNTSTKADPDAKKQNAFFNNSNSFSGTDFVRLQYHTGFPGVDPVNTAYSATHNARAAFYGIDVAPSSRIDGSFKTGEFLSWGSSYYDDRKLDPAFVKINPVLTKTADGMVKINTSITTTASISKGTYVFTVLAEKTMDDPKFKGQNGEQQFNYVVKDIFPSPSGYRLPDDVIVVGNSPVTFSIPEVTWASQDKLLTSGNGAIVVFLQDDSQGKKEVLQAILLDNPIHPDIVTGLEPATEEFSFYPVPADKVLQVELVEKSKGRTPLLVFDSIGKVVVDSGIEEGQQSKTFNTSDWTGGVYIIHLETEKGTVRKKVMILH